VSKNDCGIDLYHNEISDNEVYSLQVIFGWRCLGFVLSPDNLSVEMYSFKGIESPTVFGMMSFTWKLKIC